MRQTCVFLFLFCFIFSSFLLGHITMPLQLLVMQTNKWHTFIWTIEICSSHSVYLEASRKYTGGFGVLRYGQRFSSVCVLGTKLKDWEKRNELQPRSRALLLCLPVPKCKQLQQDASVRTEIITAVCSHSCFLRCWKNSDDYLRLVICLFIISQLWLLFALLEHALMKHQRKLLKWIICSK